MDDKTIIDLFYSRDESALTETESKYGSFCRNIAYNILADTQDSEECMNDTLLRAWNSIPPSRPAHLRAYLGAIVRNLAINLYNKNRSRKKYESMDLMLEELEECIPSRQHVEDHMEEEQLTQLLNQWLMKLKPDERNLFTRRYWYAIPVSTLAREAGISANAMASRLKRIRDKLKTYLESEGIKL